MHLKSLLPLLVVCLTIVNINTHAQTAYRIYDNTGKAINFEEMTRELMSKDILFFGEIHNQPISHWLTLELIEQMDSLSGDLQVGLEMFERDQQQTLDDLSNALFKSEKLTDYTRVWNNYDTDYKPFVNYCLEHHIPLVASNIPRKYASFVFSHGIDSLYTLDIPSHLLPEKGFPIDTNLASYAEINDMAQQMGHGGGFLLEAQAIKDICMAESIVNNLPVVNDEVKGKLIHVNGVFHTKNKEGIAWYINYLNNKLTTAVISCMQVDDVDEFPSMENNDADYHILINEKITKSYD